LENAGSKELIPEWELYLKINLSSYSIFWEQELKRTRKMANAHPKENFNTEQKENPCFTCDILKLDAF
jgi:hypothetical protein|tara:strand:+ start:2098 stop:2301 length:204 start_codon:yes stop_codon:yes gene_type:complete